MHIKIAIAPPKIILYWPSHFTSISPLLFYIPGQKKTSLFKHNSMLTIILKQVYLLWNYSIQFLQLRLFINNCDTHPSPAYSIPYYN